jgi:hypothetical protein
MQLRFTQMLSALRQALAFVTQYASKFPDIASGGAGSALSDAIDGLASRAVAQATHQLGTVGQLQSEKKLARALRRNHINPLVRVAKLAVQDVAELTAVQIPPSRSNNTELATKAIAMANAVEQFEAALIAGGLRPDFRPRMFAAAQALLDAVSGKKGHRRGRVGATGAIERQIEVCRRVVSAVDSLVKASIPEHDPVLVEWDAVLRDVRGSLASPAEEESEAPPGQPDPPVLALMP